MRSQHVRPLNPQGFGPVAPDLAFNAAIRFVANTNLQAYSSETTLSYLVQMAWLTVQDFLSTTTGMALAFAWAYVPQTLVANVDATTREGVT
jgi:potassium-transporting ATPase potassium-binding subunit